MILKSQGLISAIGRKARRPTAVAAASHPVQGDLLRSDQDKQMAKNVQRALAVELQDLSSAFRASQNAYLSRTCACR